MPGGPPRGEMGPEAPRPPHADWVKAIDTDKNGTIDANEFQAAMDATFAEYDRNKDGVLTPDELRKPKPPMGPPPAPRGVDQMEGRPQGPPPGAPHPGPGNNKVLPPFFFIDKVQEGQSLTRAQFDQMVRGVFAEMDKNSDGALSREESKPPPRPNGPGRPEGQPDGPPPPPPNAQFIGAELRFGDRLIKSKPFSADMVMEDNRRLFDGSTVTKQSKGAVYRDSEGRTRREQPLENFGGVNIVGSDSRPQTLVFISDLTSGTQIFLDQANKIARKDQMGQPHAPRPEREGPPDAKTESLGTKTIEGVSAEGTRTTFEIPAGQIGNAKPIQVVDERWFSTELQVVVMSRHLDPVAGEHVFRLVNIRQSEPAADLFTVPAGFKVENRPGRRPEE